MLKSVALHNELALLEKEQSALRFFETQPGTTPAQNRQIAQEYNLTSVLRGKRWDFPGVRVVRPLPVRFLSSELESILETGKKGRRTE
jgi:hypothetical protein